MGAHFRLSELVPSGLLVERIAEVAATIIVAARAVAPRGFCPRCGTASSRVHSRYTRRVADLPCVGGASSCMLPSGASFVPHLIAIRRFLPSALAMAYCRPVHAGPPVSSVWSTISALLWGAVRRRALPSD